jgi:hypothetical protein
VLEVAFILLEFPSPSRRIFIGSHSLPPLWFAVSVFQKGFHKFPPSNPQEKGPENNPRKTPRKGSENHHQEQPGTTPQGLEKPRRIIYTSHKGSYKV